MTVGIPSEAKIAGTSPHDLMKLDVVIQKSVPLSSWLSLYPKESQVCFKDKWREYGDGLIVFRKQEDEDSDL